nr:MAG TPA: hypothetical protein [Caudoviricetes sp.]
MVRLSSNVFRSVQLEISKCFSTIVAEIPSPLEISQT